MNNDNQEVVNEMNNTNIGSDSVNSEGTVSTPDADSEIKMPPNNRFYAYRPQFTDISDKYRRRGDARIRERLGIKTPVEEERVENPDEIKLDPTIEFDSDFLGTQDAKEPQNIAVDESDESISVMKFADQDDELEAEAAKEREEIKKLLASDTEFNPAVTENIETPKADAESAPEEETNIEKKAEDYTLPDPDPSDFGVFEFEEPAPVKEERPPESTPAPAPKPKKKKTVKKIRVSDREFSNPIQRDGIKDRFLDSLIAIKIRMFAALAFSLGIFVFEVLSASRVIDFNLFPGSNVYTTVGLVDLLLCGCILVLSLPEIIIAIKSLVMKRFTADLLPLPMFVLLGLYTMTVGLVGVSRYALFGMLFATITVPILVSSYFRTKADFIAFKMVSQPDDKQVIDLQNTRELEVENQALDGAIDEYRSKLSRTYATSFVSDFFKHSEPISIEPSHFAIVYGIPFAVALIAGIIAYFLSWSFVTGMAVLTLVAMLGCPVFSIICGRISFYHAQKAALCTDSTVIGEDAYRDYAGVDVFAFDDTDIFGPEDVNLKRFMLYCDKENMEKVMRQMCALFAAVGGPLDYMFSGIIDNRVRHKTATNVIIEDDGICGDVAGRNIAAGSEEYMKRNGIAIPSIGTSRDGGTSLDTIKIMYAAEDGEITAKFYIRYSFSEEFTSTIPSLRESGIIPLVYTRDPNVSVELLNTLTAGNVNMRLVKLYNPTNEDLSKSRVGARMITYGDRLDAVSMIILSKKYNNLSLYLKFVELCVAIIGMVIAVALAIIGLGRFNLLLASLWHVITCVGVALISRIAFLRDTRSGEVED